MKALGMESNFIADEMITCSDQDPTCSKARLMQSGRWYSRTPTDSWLQVDFIMITIVLGISTQGNDSHQCCNHRANGAKRRSGRKPGTRATNRALGKLKVVVDGRD